VNRHRAPLVLLSIGLVASACIPSDEGGRSSAERPNILLIVTDDQRAGRLSPMMPHTDAWFAARGTRFVNAFATTPRCCPARVSFLTGLYAHNHGIHGEGVTPASLESLEPLMIERILHDAGYRTGLFGKYLNNWPNDHDPDAFDRWATTPRVTYSGAVWNVDGREETVEQNSTPYIADRSIEFLQGAESSDDVPWFVHIGFMAPHPPSITEARYDDVAVPPLRRSPAMRERDRSDKPPFVRKRPFRTVAEIQSVRVPQLRSLAAVDDQIDRIVRRLEDLGESDDTLAVFISDNGLQWGEHALFGKSTPYLPSVRVPLYLRWPGHVAPGAEDDRLVGGIDLAPTLLSAAGLEPGGTPDGIDLLDPGADRSYLLLEFRGFRHYPLPTWSALVTTGVEYVEYVDDRGRVDFREFYRIRGDPQQLVNVLRDGDPTNDPDVGALSAILERLRTCAGEVCRT
jgi:arylsulfatase A-like enzyme